MNIITGLRLHVIRIYVHNEKLVINCENLRVTVHSGVVTNSGFDRVHLMSHLFSLKLNCIVNVNNKYGCSVYVWVHCESRHYS